MKVNTKKITDLLNRVGARGMQVLVTHKNEGTQADVAYELDVTVTYVSLVEKKLDELFGGGLFKKDGKSKVLSKKGEKIATLFEESFLKMQKNYRYLKEKPFIKKPIDKKPTVKKEKNYPKNEKEFKLNPNFVNGLPTPSRKPERRFIRGSHKF